MSFLSAYSGTRRVDLGGGYWVDVKMCLSALEKQRADKVLTGDPVVDQNGQGKAKVDLPGFQTEMLLHSITAWNLDEEDGTVWALSPEPVKRKNISRLPAPVFEQVYQVVNELNGPQAGRERAQFPVAGVGGDPHGDAGAPVAVDVLGGDAAVEAAGPAQGGLGVPPVA